MNFFERYNDRAQKSQSFVCVGLDSAYEKLPSRFFEAKNPQLEFNIFCINETQSHVSAYKINTAFYEARGVDGFEAMKNTVAYIHEKFSDIMVIGDAKRADIGSTNEAYAKGLFDELGFDAVTLNPYLGSETLEPFLKREDKGCFILCRTSNSGAGEFQDMKIEGKPLWLHVARHVNIWNSRKNCGLVIGATYPEEMRSARAACPDLTFLVPGVGAQGGNVAEVVSAGIQKGKGLSGVAGGLIINSGRAIIFAEKPGLEVNKLKSQINDLLS